MSEREVSMLEYLVNSILPGYELPDLQTSVDVSALLHYPSVFAVVQDGQVYLDYTQHNDRVLMPSQRRVIAVWMQPVTCDCNECLNKADLVVMREDMTGAWSTIESREEGQFYCVHPITHHNLPLFLCHH